MRHRLGVGARALPVPARVNLGVPAVALLPVDPPALPPPPTPTPTPPPPPQLQDEVYEEAAKYGSVSGVVVATPTPQVQDLMPGRCYIRYNTPEDAAKGAARDRGRGSPWQGCAGMCRAGAGRQARRRTAPACYP